MAIDSQTCPHGTSVYERCDTCNRENEARKRVEDAFEVVSKAINGGYGSAIYFLADALSNDHPTLAGQFAKAVGIGIVRRADYNPEWKPWDTYTRPLCTIPHGVNYAEFSDKAWEHPDHDGRLDCSTVVGAILMARQSYI